MDRDYAMAISAPRKMILGRGRKGEGRKAGRREVEGRKASFFEKKEAKKPLALQPPSGGGGVLSKSISPDHVWRFALSCRLARSAG